MMELLLKLVSDPFVRRGIGIFFVFLISFLMSSNKKNIPYKNIFFMFFSIWILGYLLIRSFGGVNFINGVSHGVEWLYGAAAEGARFLFGELLNQSGAWGFIFAFRVLPMIIFFSSLTSLLYYFGVIQWLVHIVGYVIRPFFGTTGPETLCAIGNSFLSQTEAPLLIKSYLKSMTESEIFVVMVSGMGTISCGLFAAYGALGIPVKHLLISSILSIPSTLLISKMWVPPTGKENYKEKLVKDSEENTFFEVLGAGTSSGLMLALHIGAMLLVVMSLLFCINEFLGFIGGFFGLAISLQSIFGLCMWPAAWALGIPFNEIAEVGFLIGTKIGVNEMVAYINLAKMNLSVQGLVLATYSLCGFSNFSCIGIQLGGIGSMEEKVKPLISKLGVRAVFAGALSNLLIAYIIGFFI